MGFDDRPADRQPKAETVAVPLAAGIEKHREDFVVDAGAEVANHDLGEPAARLCQYRDPGPAFAAGRLAGVAQQVGQDLFDLHRIDQQPIGIGIDRDPQFEVCLLYTSDAADQVARMANNLARAPNLRLCLVET